MTRDTMIATFLTRHGYGEAGAAPDRKSVV